MAADDLETDEQMAATTTDHPLIAVLKQNAQRAAAQKGGDPLLERDLAFRLDGYVHKTKHP